MAVADVALTARARGIATHLLSRAVLEDLARADDLATLTRRLARAGVVPAASSEAPDVFALERAAARRAGDRLRQLYPWQRRRPGVLDVFEARADRRSLRALLRGAAQGASTRARLGGLVPTRSLPPRLMERLAAQASVSAVVHELLLDAYPDADRLLAAARQAPIGLLALEAALLDGFARRAAYAARGTDDVLQAFVGEVIDAGNAINALLLAGDPREIDPSQLFVDGGRWLPRPVFVAAAGAGAREAAAGVLTAALARSPLAAIVSTRTAEVSRIERAFFEAALQRITLAARRDPLGTAPLLRVLLLIEAEARNLRTLAWGAALGVPPASRLHQLMVLR
jgi:vacuolar-type H+-ATPase subunit C/Vma6